MARTSNMFVGSDGKTNRFEDFFHHTVHILYIYFNRNHTHSPSSNKRSGLKHGRNKTEEVSVKTKNNYLIPLIYNDFF